MTETMLPTVSFIGRSNAGKTTLLAKVVSDLRSRGFRVGVIKHSPHGFEIDHQGKDSSRLLEAGSTVVGVSSPNKVALIENIHEELSLAQVQALFQGKVDLLLTEGYKGGDTPKIVVTKEEGTGEALTYKGKTLAVISSELSSFGVPEFSPLEVLRIVDLLANLTVLKTGRHNRFERLLTESEAVHGHICPGQVLGVRMALMGCRELGIEDPREQPKRLVVYVEIDRCATDAIQVVTGCKLGKRTMKYVDYGKVAATFVDLHTGDAIRVAAREDAREKAALRQADGYTKYETQLNAYKEMPEDELFITERVQVKIPDEDMPGPPRERVVCHQCGEGVNDSREVRVAGKVLCRSCAHGGYYQPLSLELVVR